MLFNELKLYKDGILLEKPSLIVVNKMDDLLNHNTQNLQGSPHTCKKSGGVQYNFFEENTYEVPHVLPANLRGGGGSATGYYDSRDVIRPTYFTSVRS